MSDVKELQSRLESLSEEQFQQIAGGGCSASEIIEAIRRLQESYETLVDFTSHVIERVAGT